MKFIMTFIEPKKSKQDRDIGNVMEEMDQEDMEGSKEGTSTQTDSGNNLADVFILKNTFPFH